MSSRKNRLFIKYGHDCEMSNNLDPLPLYIPGHDMWSKVRRAIIRFRMVSEVNNRSSKYLRSQGAIACDKERHLKEHFYMIHPFSDLRKCWECFMIVILIIQFIIIPIDIAYRQGLHKNITFKKMRLIFDCLLVMDVLLSFLTGYFDEYSKQCILDPKKIAIRYLKTYFFLDLVSSFPTQVDLYLGLDPDSELSTAFEFISIVKILRLITFIIYIHHTAEIFGICYIKLKITLIMIYSFLYFHLICCTLIFNYSFKMNGFSLFGKQNDTSKDISRSYLGTIYDTAIITCNAGFGLEVPTTNIYRLYIIVIWVTSRLFFVYIITHVSEVAKAKTSSVHKYREMVKQLREYMSHKQLPEYMQRRLLTYYEFRFQKSYFRESEILATISGQLRQEIVMHSCRKLVEDVAFFKGLPLTLLVRIVSCLRSEVFLINDVIVRANTPGDSMFFIASGTVAVYTSSGKEICHLEDGSHFGEIALVMKDELRVASVVAVEVCELYRLDRKDFVRAILPYPDLLDTIERIAADRMEKTTMLDELNRREIATKRMY